MYNGIKLYDDYKITRKYKDSWIKVEIFELNQ